MSDYRQQGIGQGDEPRQRIPEAFWPDYMLSMALLWTGVNNRMPADKLPNGLVPNAQNVRMRTGDIAPRHGLVKPGWANQFIGSKVYPAGTTLYGAGVFSDPATREWNLCAADGQIFALTPNNGRFSVAMPPGVQIRSACAFVQAFDKVFCFRGRYLAPLVMNAWTTGFEDVEPHYDMSGATVYNAAVQPISQEADEVAYGPFLTVDGMKAVGNLVTVTTTQPHGYVTGADITIRGMNPTAYNGRWNITVLDDYNFTFWFSGNANTTPNLIAVSSITVSGLWATVTTTAAHGYSTGQYVEISGATPAGYNGAYQITVTGTTTFTFVLVNTPGAAGAAAMWLTPVGGTTVQILNVTTSTNYFLALTAGAHGMTVGQKFTLQVAQWQAMPGSSETITGTVIAVPTTTTFQYAPDEPLVNLAVSAGMYAGLGNVQNRVTITSLTVAGTTATAITSTPHGFLNGSMVYIGGVNPLEYTGLFAVTITGLNSFTYSVPAAPVVPATGTIKSYLVTGQVSNMSLYWAASGDVLPLPTGALTNTSGTTTATVTYTGHGLSVGQWITVAGAIQPQYNGLFQVVGVSGNTFTYNLVAPQTTTPATGAITVTKPTVAAGNTPDSNPTSWTQIYDVLPNADDALYINEVLLVPTAYTPGDTAYDSTSSYTKKDYIVAMDILDPVHFQFTNGFRINQGDDSEITNLVKFDANTVIVTKGKCWGIISNVQQGDYSQITFDLHPGIYGCPAVRSAVAWGKSAYFPSSQRGLVSLQQTANGVLQGQDVPFSNDIDAWVKRINWNAASQQRVAVWNDFLYWAVALDSSTTNNTVLVYDFRAGAWASLDTGMTVKEFFMATYGGRDRLFHLDNAGWVNLMEEATGGDQVADLTQPQGLNWAAIVTDVTLKGHLFGQPGQKSFPLVELGIAVWNASVTVTVSSGGMRSVRATTLTNKTFSRTSYLKPFNQLPWNALNVNNDYGNPNRGDYSVVLQEGLNLTGCSTFQEQELFLRPSTKNFRASYALIRVQNAQGRLRIKAVTPAAQPGERRIGIMI